MAGVQRSAEDAWRRIALPEQLAVADCRGSALSGRERPRIQDRSPLPAGAEILVRPDAPLRPASAPRSHCPRHLFGCAAKPQTTRAIRAKALRSAARVPVDRVDGWANREAR